MKALLDVNFLIVLLDSGHKNHHIVKEWFLDFIDNPNNIWLSCTTTQMGCIRILSTPTYSNPFKIQEIQKILTGLINKTNHQFILSDIDLSNSDLINWQYIQGNKQLTDVYLLALAKLHNASFVSLDTKISPIVIKDFDSQNLITLL